MNKNKNIYFAIGLIAIAFLTLFVWLQESEKRYNWRERYKSTGKQPYDTYVIQQLIERDFAKNMTIIDAKIFECLTLDASIPSTYMLIGEAMKIDSADIAQLTDFVAAGNTAFISSKTISSELMDIVYQSECNNYTWYDYTYYEDTIAFMHLDHLQFIDTVQYPFQFFNKKNVLPYNWHYVDEILFCEADNSLIELGTVNGYSVNYFSLKHGEGSFYFHTSPLAFSNYHMIDSVGLAYAAGVFSHLPSHSIYWDSYNLIAEAIARKRNQAHSNSSNKARSPSESPLQYILSQPPLAWAWYLLLGLALLYLIFNAKRRQRTIPVLAKNSNTSLEFIQTIGRLHYLNQNHRYIALQQMNFFFSFIREKYNIHSKNAEGKTITKLSLKSEVDITFIEKIFLYYKNIQNSYFVSAKTLSQFYQMLQTFYKNCK